MGHFGPELEARRKANAPAMQRAFGLAVVDTAAIRPAAYRTIRAGGKATIFTVGYEKRSGDGLMSLLRDAGVDVLADVREKPMSRVADFRAAALRKLCEQVGIAYQGWPELGSTEEQRDQLKETGDFQSFARQFRQHMVEHGGPALDRLAQEAELRSIALLCYERQHEECHRSIVAELLADRLDATIVAI